MFKNEDDLVIDSILKHSHIQKENPFGYAIEGALSEWIQLLLVIERIKLNQPAFETLKKIARFTRDFLSNDEVEQQTYNLHDHTGINTNPVRPSNNEQMLRKWSWLHYFFETLDEGKKFSVFFSKVNEIQSIHSKNLRGKKHSKELLTHVIPELCDELSFSWENLNKNRINYPHSIILRGFIEGDKILEAIDDLISFDSNQLHEIKKLAVSNFIFNVKNGNTNYPCDIDIIKALKYRTDFVRSINDEIYKKILSETVKLIRKINCSAHLHIEHDKNGLGFKSIMNEHIKVKSFDNGIDIYLSDEILIDTFNDREEIELTKILFSKFKEHIKDNKKLDVYIKDDINRNQSFVEFNDITTKLIYKVNNYNLWIANQNNYLFNKELKLPKNIIVRGIKFSIWYQSYIIENKKNILNGATKYREELNIDAKELTIKQSYEFIKKLATTELTNIIIEQTKERLYTINQFNMLLLKPLNYTMYDCIKKYNEKLTDIFNINYITSDFDEIINTYKAVELLVSEHEAIDISYTDAYEKVFGKKYECNNNYQSNKSIKISQFKSLLNFNLDIK